VEAHRLTDDGIEVGQGVELVPASQDGVSASVGREGVRSTGAKLAMTHMLGSSVGHAISSARSLSWIAVFSHSAYSAQARAVLRRWKGQYQSEVAQSGSG
jgi:hypothetical protein